MGKSSPVETIIAPTSKKKPVARKTSAATKKPVAKKMTAAAKPAPAKKAAVKKPVVAKKVNTSSSAKHCALIAHVLDENKAEDIVSLDLANKCSFADFMVVASGRSQRHVSALADHVADALKKAGMPPLNIEGKDSADWVLIDAGDVVVHLFRPEVRQFYNIEKMWAIAAPNV